MKKLFLITILLVCAYSLMATVWHVNNNLGVSADYTTVSSAASAASSGDTLYVYGSVNDYGALTLSKRLVIIGPGYFLDENSYTQAVKHPALITHITFNNGSQNSVLTGIKTNYMSISADGITIKRNYIGGVSVSTDIITINGADNVTFIQNYVTSNGTYYDLMNISSHTPGLLIANNIFYHEVTGGDAVTMSSNSIATITNNSIRGDLSLYNCDLYNNILSYGSFDGHTTTNFYNNLGHANQFYPPGQNGNQCNVDMGDVYVYSNTSEGQYVLAGNSPARGAGAGGEDCGIFGGLYPYKRSGIPSEIPVIYEFSAPGVGFSIPVQLKVKAHN